jgi:hypothetical protein
MLTGRGTDILPLIGKKSYPMPFEESQASAHRQTKRRTFVKAGQLISSVVALATLTVIVTAGTLGRSKARAGTERIMPDVIGRWPC